MKTFTVLQKSGDNAVWRERPWKTYRDVVQGRFLGTNSATAGSHTTERAISSGSWAGQKRELSRWGNTVILFQSCFISKALKAKCPACCCHPLATTWISPLLITLWLGHLTFANKLYDHSVFSLHFFLLKNDILSSVQYPYSVSTFVDEEIIAWRS